MENFIEKQIFVEVIIFEKKFLIKQNNDC